MGQRTFSVGDKVVFRESETGPAELGEVVEILPATDSHPNGGLYVVQFDNGYRSEVFWTELSDRFDYCPDGEDNRHQITSGSCDQCGKKNFN